jgi:hypothetical protein
VKYAFVLLALLVSPAVAIILYRAVYGRWPFADGLKISSRCHLPAADAFHPAQQRFH